MGSYYEVDHLASRLGVSYTTVYKWVKEKNKQIYRNSVFISDAELHAMEGRVLDNIRSGRGRPVSNPSAVLEKYTNINREYNYYDGIKCKYADDDLISIGSRIIYDNHLYKIQDIIELNKVLARSIYNGELCELELNESNYRRVLIEVKVKTSKHTYYDWR